MSTSAVMQEAIGREYRTKINRLDRRLMHGDPFFIFNVFPRQHIFYASYGARVVQACPAGAPHSPALVIPAFVSDFSQSKDDSASVDERAIPGEDVVAEILNMFGDPANTPLKRWGVFVSRSERPGKREVETAKEDLFPTLQRLVDAGNKLYMGDARDRDQIGELHRIAAKTLGLKPQWMLTDHILGTCEGCGSSIVPGAAFCAGGCVIDEARARKLRPQLFVNQKGA